MDVKERVPQQQLEDLLKDITIKGQESESIQMNEFITEIKDKLLDFLVWTK